jgi:hypothetical protein
MPAAAGCDDLQLLLQTAAAGTCSSCCWLCWLGRHNACYRIAGMELSRSHQLPALPQGLDFFFANRQHAVKLVDFLQVWMYNFCACLLRACINSVASELHVTAERMTRCWVH